MSEASPSEILARLREACEPLPVPWALVRAQAEPWVRADPERAREAVRTAHAALSKVSGVGEDA